MKKEDKAALRATWKIYESPVKENRAARREATKHKLKPRRMVAEEVRTYIEMLNKAKKS